MSEELKTPNVVSEREAALFLGLAIRTLQNRRWRGLPPRFVRLGRSIRYRVSDLEDYLDTCLIEPRRG